MAHVDIQDVRERQRSIATSEEELYFFDVSKQGIFASAKNKDIALLRNEQAVLEAVYNILLTEPGERVMNPRFGAYLQSYLFEPIDIATARSMLEAIEESLRRFEPRITNTNVKITPDHDNNTFIVDISFTVITTNRDVVINTSLEKIR